ncbi:hypothetical protein L2E82_10398 [Cichorium intybus]|uniref:Uncharacterized protein n=1 Tax=Cichorium intybus TaxID=13427 RepID=A0ACB9GCG0_CICIN|nr:hypothetical protein L2E82_10398 [Cichorium intybus]
MRELLTLMGLVLRSLDDFRRDGRLEGHALSEGVSYDNQVWNLVDNVSGRKTVGCKWIFKKKTDMDGKVHTYKARLAAKGFTQTPGVDYDETFSPVAKINSIRIMLSIAAFHDYKFGRWMSKPLSLTGN